ncbi:MAG: AAA family ATPase [Bradyrhizobium sp.]|uniref:AAA family ATPase n=1 Tax=Bradyrhizobium sp. TaxID=376 RepID=UPI0029B52483|nr:AAA family ATPase [Bradyrhizobium sp.]MDX3966820.1 AAA family ATPase [Bradyrhizobium sp.]
MHFRRIAVRNFRKLAAPVVIDGLGDGVTVIAGDNEEGKSTLLDAIRAGLFERHNLGGKAIETMQPFGSAVRPEIQLDFEIDGEAYAITKGFAQKPSARLTTPNGTFEGAAAEERLAELLTFRVPQRGESKPDDQGVLGLFWLEQGRGLEGLGLGETGRSTLRASLVQEVGDILGGTRGRKLLEAARAKRDALLTARSKPRGELSAVIDEAATATARVAELEGERLAYDEEIDELARVRRELARIEAECVLEKAQASLTKAQEQAKAIDTLRQQEEAATQAVGLAQAQLENASERWKRRQSLIDAVGRHERAMEVAQAALARLETETQDIAGRVEVARAALATAAEKSGAAEARVAVSQTKARIGALDKEIAELDRRRAEVDKLAAQRKAAQERLSVSKIDQRSFERLQRLDGTVREARAALGAVATRVRFTPIAQQVVRKGDEEVMAGQDIDVTEATHFALEGFGTVDVEPGASDLADRQSRLKEAEGALSKALAVAGVTNLDVAKARLSERTEAETEINEVKRLIAAYAPEGVDALKAAHADRSAERERLNEALDLSLAADVADLEAEARALAAARGTEDAARTALDKGREQQHTHITQIAIAKQALQAANGTLNADKKYLDDARGEASDADLAARLENARASLGVAERRKAGTVEQIAAANPEEIELRREQATAALQNVQAEQRRLRDSAIGLENRLTALGKSGIGEQLEEALGHEAQILARRDRLQADALAWDLLAETLSSAERDAKEAFLEPVLKRVDPFLRLLLPEARITLDEETLEITGVARDGRQEPYETLSVGTREQLSVLVRLAFAVYLREKGVPAAVILDDSLVYADDDRFERMQLALRKAAATVQILILTCRPRDWRQFGAPIRRLADGKAKELAGANGRT